jgi:hypothetical protein
LRVWKCERQSHCLHSWLSCRHPLMCRAEHHCLVLLVCRSDLHRHGWFKHGLILGLIWWWGCSVSWGYGLCESRWCLGHCTWVELRRWTLRRGPLNLTWQGELCHQLPRRCTLTWTSLGLGRRRSSWYIIVGFVELLLKNLELSLQGRSCFHHR